MVDNQEQRLRNTILGERRWAGEHIHIHVDVSDPETLKDIIDLLEVSLPYMADNVFIASNVPLTWVVAAIPTKDHPGFEGEPDREQEPLIYGPFLSPDEAEGWTNSDYANALAEDTNNPVVFEVWTVNGSKPE